MTENKMVKRHNTCLSKTNVPPKAARAVCS